MFSQQFFSKQFMKTKAWLKCILYIYIYVCVCVCVCIYTYYDIDFDSQVTIGLGASIKNVATDLLPVNNSQLATAVTW